MVTIIMSIGFSVDFTAHVSYGYVALSHETDPLKRMQVVLGARAWPITQVKINEDPEGNHFSSILHYRLGWLQFSVFLVYL